MINLLNNKKLLKYGSYINGEWIVDGNYFDVINPYNGETLAQMSGCNPQIINKSIESADEAMSTWKTLTARERNEYLIAWYKKIIENKEDLSIILTLEQGKPIKESRAEISYGAEYIKWFAEEAKRIYGDVIPASVSGKKILVTKEPIGVVAAITPWNFPNAMITRKVSAAMAAGCSVLVKPSELTPLSALSLAELAHEAGIPEGVFNVIITDKPQEFANEVIASKIVKKLSFTGSTRVGKLLMTQCGHEIKRLSLELGGNAPFIVFEDADLENAADQCIASKFRNTGQTCVCTNRIFVHKNIYNLFLKLLQDRLNSLKIGNGLDENTDIGPLINSAALKKVENLQQGAIEKGAHIITGGNVIGKLLIEPTIICEVNTDMAIYHQEIFGPIATIIKFETEEEVIEMANDTEYGLASYFFSKDYAKVWRVAEKLQYGMVGINTGMLSMVEGPFGGIKQSGFGREGSKYGIEEYLNLKYLCLGGLD